MALLQSEQLRADLGTAGRDKALLQYDMLRTDLGVAGRPTTLTLEKDVLLSCTLSNDLGHMPSRSPERQVGVQHTNRI